MLETIPEILTLTSVSRTIAYWKNNDIEHDKTGRDKGI